MPRPKLTRPAAAKGHRHTDTNPPSWNSKGGRTSPSPSPLIIPTTPTTSSTPRPTSPDATGRKLPRHDPQRLAFGDQPVRRQYVVGQLPKPVDRPDRLDPEPVSFPANTFILYVGGGPLEETSRRGRGAPADTRRRGRRPGSTRSEYARAGRGPGDPQDRLGPGGARSPLIRPGARTGTSASRLRDSPRTRPTSYPSPSTRSRTRSGSGQLPSPGSRRSPAGPSGGRTRSPRMGRPSRPTSRATTGRTSSIPTATRR